MGVAEREKNTRGRRGGSWGVVVGSVALTCLGFPILGSRNVAPVP